MPSDNSDRPPPSKYPEPRLAEHSGPVRAPVLTEPLLVEPVLSEIERDELRLLEVRTLETARTNPWLRPIRPVLGH